MADKKYRLAFGKSNGTTEFVDFIAPQGEKGDPGENGVSPSVSVTAIDGGNRVTITDASGEKSFDVMNGTGGSSGGGGGSGDMLKTVYDANGNGTVDDSEKLGGKLPSEYADANHVHSKTDIGLDNVDNVRQYSASNPPPYPVTSVNGQTGDVTVGASSVEYTTAEVDTGMKWIDGKPIYRKILQVTGTNKAGESLSVPLGSFKLGFLIRLDGGFFTGEDFCCFATAHNSAMTANVYTRIRYATTAPEIRIVCGSARSIGSGYAIVEYTKA